MDNFFDYVSFLPEQLKDVFRNLEKSFISGITEVRIRKNKPLIIYIGKHPFFISDACKPINFFNSGVLTINAELFAIIVDMACNHSFHTSVNSMINGYITTKNGVRIGVGSTAVNKSGEITSVRDINSLNIRIPHSCKNCSRPILNELFVNRTPNVIIASPPSGGKTTVLKDMALLLSNGFAGEYRKVCLADERMELSSGADTGINTDVIANYPKAAAIEIAVRTLSPQIIVCDEIGNENEVEAIRSGFDSGVSFIVSVHASDFRNLVNKTIIKKLLYYTDFDYIVLLKDFTNSFEIYQITEKEIENYGNSADNDLFSSACSVNY